MIAAAGGLACILNDEYEMFRSSVRSFGESIADGYRQRALKDEFPRDVYAQLAAAGLIGLGVSEAHGGQGADHLAQGIAVEELARADFSAAYLVFSAASSGALLERSCRQAHELLPRYVRGEIVTCLGLTEPGSGSDAAAMRTAAKPVDGGWQLRGEKTSVTCVAEADYAVVFAKTEKGPTAFLVDLNDATVSRQRFQDPGARPLGRGSISLDGTFVPSERLLGEDGRGFQLVMNEFDFTRVLLGLMCVGIAERAIELTVDYTKERMTFGKPLSTNQGVTFPIVEHLTRLEAARWLCYRGLSLRMAGRPHTKEAAMIKWWVPQLAVRAIQDCIVLHGHVGFSDEMPLQAMLRDASSVLIGDGTAQIQKIIVAREVFGRDATGKRSTT
ncbi:acyl-CoA dehydrogenase family protein [Mycolicibacterium holsaticum]|uniref:acyl-CoA dehydrogenase family protein n=1 Tax=Mycolicibacterium holsaticum TaxID=152142 RepID=UPI001C7CDCE7|nr:acyl-CoA dehydrogenase family protein [Mycolicibacterium holsaticum]MDA4109369.1 acyl-CoA dehydrogenase [Mycolicibacterium holsaticum DSM 44478 = JCM 12374]QZA11753.1 acyl-CoA dehydrogenase family protein [Mycolicibacterium holsaticum DSM 44478 = JCM 12374]UNC10761.1 acyl-CoA dehydrogenase family protein [Mycolicibacterium holsaticum DSM 44478 = JCM 12374]